MKKIIHLSVLISLISLPVLAQLGCNDPQALNYSSTARPEDKNCIYPTTVITPSTIGNIDVIESSGLVFYDGRLFTHNDSGGEPELYELNPQTGSTIKVFRLKGLSAGDIGDWEEIDHNEEYIFIGDIGNNNGTRQDLRFYRIKKSDLVGSKDTVMVDFETIPFFYPVQTDFSSSQSHNFDCEGFVAIEDTLFLFTKHRGDLNTNLYKVYNTPGPITQAAQLTSSFNVGGQITGASYNPIDNEITLAGYLNVASPFIWFFWGYNGTNVFDGYARRLELPPPSTTGQFEAICFTDSKNIIISNEGLTDAIPAKIASFPNTYTFNPSTGIEEQSMLVNLIQTLDNQIIIESIAKGEVVVYDALGKTVKSIEILQGKSIIGCQDLTPGMYVLSLKSKANQESRKIFIF